MKAHTVNRFCRLTAPIIAAAGPGPIEYSYRDSVVRGLAVRVQPSGSKTWVLRGRAPDRSARLTLGDATVISVEAAREKAHAILSGGAVPVSPAPRPTKMFSSFVRLYFQRRRTQLRPATLEKYIAYLHGTLLPAFGTKRLAQITRADVMRWFARYSAKAPGGANAAVVLLKEMLNRAHEWGEVPAAFINPCRKIPTNRRPPKGRPLSLEELGALGEALAKTDRRYLTTADAIRLLLLTGCRSGEILPLRWTQVENDQIVLPWSKTGPRVLHIGPPAVTLLERRRKAARSPFVFPSKVRTDKPVQCIWALWRRLRSAAGIGTDVRIHDLRHNFASHSVMSGETLLVTGELLGHRQSSTTARYAHLCDDFLSAAAEDIGSAIDAWLNEGRRQLASGPAADQESEGPPPGQR